jgi:hypothetical protein
MTQTLRIFRLIQVGITEQRERDQDLNFSKTVKKRDHRCYTLAAIVGAILIGARVTSNNATDDADLNKLWIYAGVTIFLYSVYGFARLVETNDKIRHIVWVPCVLAGIVFTIGQAFCDQATAMLTIFLTAIPNTFEIFKTPNAAPATIVNARVRNNIVQVNAETQYNENDQNLAARAVDVGGRYRPRGGLGAGIRRWSW